MMLDHPLFPALGMNAVIDSYEADVMTAAQLATNPSVLMAMIETRRPSSTPLTLTAYR
jgi:hypothetical protein